MFIKQKFVSDYRPYHNLLHFTSMQSVSTLSFVGSVISAPVSFCCQKPHVYFCVILAGLLQLSLVDLLNCLLSKLYRVRNYAAHIVFYR